MSDIVERLLAKADEIDSAVSRNRDEVEDGSFDEIELMREEASTIRDLQRAGEEDIVLFRAIVERRRLLAQTEKARAELAAVEATIFDHYMPKQQES